MKDAVFSPRVLFLLPAYAVLLFALTVLVPAYDDAPLADKAGRSGANAFSRSAIGHIGLYELLRRSGLPAGRATDNALAKAGARGVLILAEPELQRMDRTDLLKTLQARRLLLVLPKWSGSPDQNRPDWVAQVKEVPLVRSQSVLRLACADGMVLREPWPTAGTAWTDQALTFSPTGAGQVQLMRSSFLRPLLGTDQGMLLGELREGEQHMLILSDPDILSNHGLAKGDNAALMLEIIRRLHRPASYDPGAPIIFDESVHGFRTADNSLLKRLFRLPFAVIPALCAASAVLLLLAGGGRFGAALPVRPELDFGKAGLIANAARLLDYAGHHGVVLRRYARMIIRQAGHSLHAPPGLDDEALAVWLDRIGKARKAKGSGEALLRASLNPGQAPAQDELSRLLAVAHDLHRWKGELLHGPATRRHDR